MAGGLLPPLRHSYRSMFHPPRCPNRACSQHRSPTPEFFIRKGTYWPKCRPQPVPRFRCRTCDRGFSRQTFRADYHDHKPHLNAALVRFISSGVGIRQSARMLNLSLRCTELKLRKIGRHLRRLNLNLRSQLSSEANFHFDELETYEGQRNTRPLTLPLLIESRTRYIVWAESAPIRPRGRMSKRRLEAINRSEARFGPRRDLSRQACLRTLSRGAKLAEGARTFVLSSDEKSTYPGLARITWAGKSIVHLRTNSRVVRDEHNPLFPINHEEAMLRDRMGRLRRRSWLVSKKRRYLDICLHVHIAMRNLVGKRFHRDSESPAQMLGFVRRRLRVGEILSWRQDWGALSGHPLNRRGRALAA